ncbi:MAG: FAD-binding oxidoreductase [Mycobacteriaceae bacterium]|nr:FAD-binding oxidoreductase [Mycobacteriaceae bacterium]
MTDTELRAAVSGRVILPGDEGFDAAAQPWNRAAVQRVSAVVEPTTPEDAVALVHYARKAGRSLFLQPTGHGPSGDVDDAILVRTTLLGGVAIQGRTARVGAGVKWGEVQGQAAPLGLSGVCGSSPGVGVTGYTLGGGVGWFSRKYGMAADRVTALEVVDADGDQRRVTADSDPELFWALRGGSGDFALVTALEFELVAAPALYGGAIIWPAAQGPAVLDAFRTVTADAPDELTVWVSSVRPPGGAPGMTAMYATYLGNAEEGRELLRPFESLGGANADTRRALSPAEIGEVTNDPTDPTPSAARTELLTDLDVPALPQLFAAPPEPLLVVGVRHLGGALAAPVDAACGSLPEPYLVQLMGLTFTPELAAAVHTAKNKAGDALAAKATGRRPYTFLSPGDTAADAFDPDTLARLRSIKRARDPHGVFRAAFTVAE